MNNNRNNYYRSNYTEIEYLDTASFKLFSNKSWSEWIFLRQYSNLPVLKKKILDTYKDLLNFYNIRFTDFQDDNPLGSYVNLNQYFENFLKEYIRNGWISSEKVIYIKITFDNTKITKVGSEGFWFVVVNVLKPQSPEHCWEISRFRGSERRASIKKSMEEMGLNEFLEEYDNATVNNEQTLSFFVSADWIALVALFWVPIPATKDWSHTTCIFCTCEKAIFKTGYINDPFLYILVNTQTSDFANFPLQHLTMDQIHYDPMHGLARVLTLTVAQISRILLQGEKTRYADCISCFTGDSYTINLKTPQGFSPKQMKNMIGKSKRSSFMDFILSYFDNTQCFLVDLNQENLQELSDKNCIEILFESVFTFYDFCYKKYPNGEDILKLDKARTAFMGIFSNYQWNMEVTVHYMMNHLIEKLNFFKFKQGSTTVAPSLCEGSEQENYQAKKEKIVLGVDLPGLPNETHRSRRRVERKTLKLIFTFFGCSNSFDIDAYRDSPAEPDLLEYDWMPFLGPSEFILDQLANYTEYEELDRE